MDYISSLNSRNSKMNPIILDRNQKIYPDCLILDSSLGQQTVIGERSLIQGSIITDFVRIDRDNQILDSSIGLRSYTGRFSLIFKTLIGSYTSISYGCIIGAAAHKMHRASTHPFIYKSGYYQLLKDNLIESDLFEYKLDIGNDVWIGANVTIIRNISIGDGAVIGANSFVNKNVPPYAIAVGSPIRIVGYRFPEEIITKLLDLEWWKWSDDKINKNPNFFIKPLTMESFEFIQ